MKLIFCLILYLFNLPFLKAQDTLFLNDGSELHIKLIEIGENTLSYKKSDNLNGPTYTMDLSKAFLVVYSNGNREFFQTPDNASKSSKKHNEKGALKETLYDSNFELQLIKTQSIPDSKNKWIHVTAEIEVYSNDQLFTMISLSANQRKDIALDFTDPKESYLLKSNITISSENEKISNVLFQKFENASGKGYGWALPPNFFTLEPSACCVAYLEQKSGNKEILGYGGITSKKISLQNCSSLEYKLLSVVLLWLETNFEQK
jgi:hypothetical protein